jgi:hypothetical protein
MTETIDHDEATAIARAKDFATPIGVRLTPSFERELALTLIGPLTPGQPGESLGPISNSIRKLSRIVMASGRLLGS